MKLYYVMDPMCSWCWGFRPVFRRLLAVLPAETEIQYVMGGLAPDTDEPMPLETCEYVQSQWRAVSAKTGAEFNWDFWQHCQPRRSTYPACRAVIAAGLQDKTIISDMIDAIQNAYYLQARNPSDDPTLVKLATEIGLNPERFRDDLNSESTHKVLHSDFKLRRELKVSSFPSVVLQKQRQIYWLASGITDTNTILDNAKKAGLLANNISVTH